MAHFAKLDNNSIVINVEVVADADTLNDSNQESEAVGIQFLNTIHGSGTWKKTSYNTKAGKYYDAEVVELPDGSTTTINSLSADQSKAFRKNFAGIGFTYDSTRDAFIPPKPYASWILNETTCNWDAPVPYPSIETYGDSSTEYFINWDEDNLRWVAKDQEDPQGVFRWNVDTSAWVSL